ncbi:TPA: hypothetical protein ACWLUJ_005758 [Pseudomonas aeruginosa]|nr:hypothetical protein [Pseudomonas aeruginosa]
MAHKFTKVLFAVEHDGKAYGVHLPADKLESLLAEAARLSPSGSLEMYPMPNQDLFRVAFDKTSVFDLARTPFVVGEVDQYAAFHEKEPSTNAAPE